MLSREECIKIIDAITYDPIVFSSFGWDRILDPNGTCCSPPPKADGRMMEQLSELFDDNPDMYGRAYESLRRYLEKNWLWRSYTVKAYAILLDGIESYGRALEMLLQSLWYRRKSIDVSIKAIEQLGKKEAQKTGT